MPELRWSRLRAVRSPVNSARRRPRTTAISCGHVRAHDRPRPTSARARPRGRAPGTTANASSMPQTTPGSRITRLAVPRSSSGTIASRRDVAVADVLGQRSFDQTVRCSGGHRSAPARAGDLRGVVDAGRARRATPQRRSAARGDHPRDVSTGFLGRPLVQPVDRARTGRRRARAGPAPVHIACRSSGSGARMRGRSGGRVRSMRVHRRPGRRRRRGGRTRSTRAGSSRPAGWRRARRSPRTRRWRTGRAGCVAPSRSVSMPPIR